MEQQRRQPGSSVAELEAYLRALRSRARMLLVIRSGAMWLACAGAALLFGGAIDYVLRSPTPIRVVGLAVAVAVGVWAVVRSVWPALRFRPSLSELALRLERRAGEVDLRGWLASALELADEQRHRDESPELRTQAMGEALSRWKRSARQGVLRTGPAAQSMLVLVVAASCLAALVLLEPSLARIGAKRMLAPWMGAEWPRRQLVLDLTPIQAHPIDEALPMRAAVVRSNRSLGNTPVRVEYRAIVGDQAGQWRSAALTGQKRRTALRELGLKAGGQGELYERLIDPGEAIASARGEEGFIEYRFFTEDDQTVTQRVQVVRPPRVVEARLSVRPPEYALPDAERAGLARGSDIDLGPGDDARATVSDVIADSRMELVVRSSKVLPASDEPPGWLAELAAGSRDFTWRTRGDRITVEAVVDRSVRLPVELQDEHGFRSREESVYSIDVRADDPPEPTVSRPESDEQLIPSAAVSIAAEARDDLGVVSATIEHRLARRPSGSEGAPPASDDAWTVLAEWSGTPGASIAVEGRLELGGLDAKPGDEVWITATASDTFAAAGLGRGPVRSSVRRLRIITESELLEQMQAELSGLRQTAMRLDEQQAQLGERLREEGAARDLAVQQSELGDRVSAQQGTLDRLMQRAARNGLNDPGLAGLLDDASRALQQASAASDRAAESIAQDQPQQAEGEQRQVRDELAGLVDLLDRGEDGWVARRSVERLIEEQRRLMEQTRQAGERMIGRDANQLTPQERSELDMIAERQREASRRAAEAIEELSERARQLNQADPSQAAAMAEAARQGRQQQVPQQLEQAAEEVQQNRTSSAQSAQQSALEAMEQMLEELENAQRHRNAALLRQLASLIESLRGLISAQEEQIEALTAAQVSGQVAGLDAGMIRLHDNTLAVLADAQQPDLAPVRAPMEEARSSQESAITGLRSMPPDLDLAGRGEQTSLLKLRDALAEAERLEEQAQREEQERIRRELRQAYREQLEQQVVVRDEAAQLAGRVLSRRERASARGLGQRQQTIHDALDDLLKGTEGLSEAAVFDFAHRRLSSLTGTSAEQLGLGEVEERTLGSMEQAVALLRSLVEALAPSQGQNEFDAGAAEAGGGGDSGGGSNSQGQQSLLPPIAELKLLRSMQALVAQQTRALGEMGEAPGDAGQLQEQLAEQARSLIERMQRQSAPRTPPPGEQPPGEPTP